MRRHKILIMAFLACVGVFQVRAQEATDHITGVVLDKWGNPVYGASVMVAGQPDTRVETDENGLFEISDTENSQLQVVSAGKGTAVIKVQKGRPVKVVLGYEAEGIDVGASRTFNRHESTAAVSTIYSEDFANRTSKDISNALFGQGLGLTTLQNAGNYSSVEPTFYVRGLQSLSSSSPLILVDGLERDMSLISPEEVESVSVLKDAAAVALYGYKGINGAVLVTTKRGRYNTKEVKFMYDHVTNFQVRRPEFVDAATYAEAINEAREYEGLSARYSQNEINAFRYGRVDGIGANINNLLPYLYPNVDWIDETFKNSGVSAKYNIEFRGGGNKFRYYTMVGLITDKGFIKNANMNDSYSTQDKYSRANLRTNLDIDLTSTTKLKLNIQGTLTESSCPGASTNLWDLIYSLPAAAFPVWTDDGMWGGSATWAGTLNPVAQSQGASYSKGHMRSLLADLTLSQDLSGFVKGLGANFRLSYDNYSSIWENHSKDYVYGGYIPSWTDNSAYGPTYTTISGGSVGEMSSDAYINYWTRQFNFAADFNYNRSFGKHDLYSQLKWEYEYRDSYGLNTTVYRQNVSWFTHYGFNKRYYVDLALLGSESSLLAPGHKWAFSPTVSAAWVLSEEDFLKNASWINFLKLRASFGVINADYIPVNDYWDQIYSTSGTMYRFDAGYNSAFGSTYIDRLATANSTHEKAYKYNVGIDATLFKGLNVTLEGYYQRRKDIWVASDGQYSVVLGIDTPFENAGIVDSWGTEVGLDYNKQWGNWAFNLGANFTWNRNQIKEQLEEMRLYDNLVQTGHRLGQVYGLIAEGFFKDEADIANSPTQNFSTVLPGDIKYRDVNGDNVIDSNDQTAIGYSTTAPEIYYSFHLGAEWKGVGIDAMFQGTGNYSAILNTKSLFWPLINNTSLSTHYYENRWTPENPNAKYPRLSSESNANNYQTNTVWLADRSFLKLRNLEVYYKFPRRLMERTKMLGSAKLYVRGTDLFCFDHIDVADPESYGATNPLNKSLVVGVAISF